MQIDWLTVAAQIINFLVLVWLLKRFLYKPITNAMRRREERIEERLAEAKEAREEAERQERDLREKEADLDARTDRILNDAREDAEDLRERKKDEIREEMKQKRAAWQSHLAKEREDFAASLRRKAGKQVLRITERILSDYTDSDAAERAGKSFAARLKALDADKREKMVQAAARKGEPALVETATALESAGKGRITRAIHDALSGDIDVEYREDPELILGLRLTLGDHVVDWSAARYLERLDSELDEIIETGRRSPAKKQDAEKSDGDREDKEQETA